MAVDYASFWDTVAIAEYLTFPNAGCSRLCIMCFSIYIPFLILLSRDRSLVTVANLHSDTAVLFASFYRIPAFINARESKCRTFPSLKLGWSNHHCLPNVFIFHLHMDDSSQHLVFVIQKRQNFLMIRCWRIDLWYRQRAKWYPTLREWCFSMTAINF